MNTQKQLQFAAFFIAVLVVSIPYCVSDAQAASVNIQSIAGADGIDGFMRRSDTITIEAQASISDTEDVQFDNLRLYVNQGATYAYFDSCDKLGDSASFSCILTRNLRGWSGVHLLEVKLYSDANKYDEGASPAATDSMQCPIS